MFVLAKGKNGQFSDALVARNTGPSGPPVTLGDAFLMEDGTSFFLLEDGTSKLILEAI